MRVAFIADVHANLEAFSAVLEDIKARRITDVYCAGDIIGYNTDCNEVVAMIKDAMIKSVAGNHDHGITMKDIGMFNDYAQKALIWTNSVIKSEHKEFLLKLPETLEAEIDNRRLYIVHGSPKDHLFGYIYPVADDAMFKSLLSETSSDVMVLGHTHLPMIKRLGRKLVINPGSVGQPRDGIPKASYAILDTVSGAVQIVRVRYDIGVTAGKVITAGLPRFLAERLFQGR